MSVELGKSNLCPECGLPVDDQTPLNQDDRPALRKTAALGLTGLVFSGIVAGVGVRLDYPELFMAGGGGAAATLVSATIAEAFLNLKYDRLGKK